MDGDDPTVGQPVRTVVVMKAKLATALSVVGVLGAGSAAALVNTQILDNGQTESGASKAVLPPASTVELSVPDLAAPDAETIRVAVPTGGVEQTTTTTVRPTTTLAPEPEVSGYLTSFNVGEAGVVTADVIEGQLVLVSAEPKAGWTVTKAEDDSNDDTEEHENTIHVEFVSSTVLVEFEAEFVDGQIVPHVESTAIGAPTAAAAPTPAAAPAPAPAVAPTGDDDSYEHDDDEYEHDDSYEDEHDEDEHEDSHEDSHESEHEDDHEDERDDD